MSYFCLVNILLFKNLLSSNLIRRSLQICTGEIIYLPNCLSWEAAKFRVKLPVTNHLANWAQ